MIIKMKPAVMRTAASKNGEMKNDTVETIFATTGDSNGEINLQWDSYEHAQSYIIQKTSLLETHRYSEFFNLHRGIIKVRQNLRF